MENDQMPSFAALLKGSNTLPVFCLEKELLEEAHTCHCSPLASPHQDQLRSVSNVKREAICFTHLSTGYSCSCQSASLFDSSLAESNNAQTEGGSESPLLGSPQDICSHIAISTPVMRKVATPAHLISDSAQEVWNESMATPTCQRAPSSTDGGWSTESSTTPMQSDVESGSGRARMTVRGREPLARVLFARESPQVDSLTGTQPFTPPRSVPSVSPLVLHAHHSTPAIRRARCPPPSPPLLEQGDLSPVGCSQELFDSPGTHHATDIDPPVSRGREEAEEEGGRGSGSAHPAAFTSLASKLDVLFMGSSQLDGTGEEALVTKPNSLSSPPHSPPPPPPPPPRLPLSKEIGVSCTTIERKPKFFQYPTSTLSIEEPLALQHHGDKLPCRPTHTPPGGGERDSIESLPSGVPPHPSEVPPCMTAVTEKASLKRFHVPGLRTSLAKKVRTEKEDSVPSTADAGRDQAVSNEHRREQAPAVPCIPLSHASSDSSTPVTSRAFSSFKTPSLPIPSAEASSCPAVVSRRVVSAKRRAGKSFRTPRPAGEVSREEEAASIARIMRQFSHTKMGEKAAHPVQRPSSCVSGFSTAGGKKLSVSAAALQHARQLIEPQDSDQCSSNSVSVGFSTASGKNLFVSDTAMEKAHSLAASFSHLLPGDQTKAGDDMPSAEQPLISCGFQAASGKGIMLRRESMSRAMSLCTELMEAMPTSNTTGPTTENGVDCSPEQSKEDQQEEEREEEDLVPQDIDMDTFATFTQFPVDSSRVDDLPSSVPNTMHQQQQEEEEEEEENIESEKEESLTRVQVSPLHQFSKEPLGCDAVQQEQQSMQEMPSSQEAHCSTVAASPSALCGLCDLFECKEDTTLHSSQLPPSDYVDHDTAGVLDPHGEHSSQEEEKLQPEILDERERKSDGVPAVKPELPALLTADQQGRPRGECHYQGSNGGLQKKKEEQKHVVAGLQTASGKPVEISEPSLRHARQLFENESRYSGTAPSSNPPLPSVANDERMCSSGLCTASGRQVKISSHALAHVRSKSSSQLQSSPPQPHFPGLMTAGGSKVKISEQALQAVRQSFRGEEESDTVAIPRVHAANRQPVSSGSGQGVRPVAGGEVEQRKSCFSSDQQAPSSGSRSERIPEHRQTTAGSPAVVSTPLIVTPEATLCDRPVSSRRSMQPRTVLASGSTLNKARLRYSKGTISLPAQEPSPVHSTPHRPFPPVWKGSLRHAMSPPALPPDASPPLSPINLTLSQLHMLTDTTLTQGDAPVTGRHGDSGFCSGEKRTGSANSSVQSPPVSCVANNTNLEDSQQEAAVSAKPQIGSLLMCRQSNRTGRLLLTQLLHGRRPLRHAPEQLLSLGVPECVLAVSINNAPQFIFKGLQFFSSVSVHRRKVCVGDGVMVRLSHTGTAGVQELWRGFSCSPGVDSKLISFQWFSNHYKWLVWKLAALEVCFPEALGGRCLTPDWLILQMKYRYDREIDRAERSALHKICEGDESCSRPMVLCVSHLHSAVGEEENSEQAPSLELTDGWYSLPVVVDYPLRQLILQGRIPVGCKLLVCGAEMVGSSEPCHPLEVAGRKRLKLSTNSTRRAHWAARMGLCYLTRPPCFLLSSLFPNGGLVPAVKVVVARVYPMLYMEKKEEGNIFRNMKAEQKVALQWREEQQKAVEVICHRVQRQFEKEVADEEQSMSVSTRRRSRRLSAHQLRQLHDGEEIYHALRASPDPDAVQEQLSRTQRTLLESYHLSLAAQRQADLQDRISRAMKEEGSKLPADRVVVPLLRVCVVQYGRSRYGKDCFLSMWKPSEAVVELLREGQGLALSHVTASPNRFRSGRVQLTATKNTSFEILKSEPSLLVNYTPRQCIAISQLSDVSDLPYGEFDTVGLVVSVTASSRGRPIDQVFLADASGSVLKINVWDGLKAMEVDKVVIAGTVVAVSNLRLQDAARTELFPSASAGDVTVFQQHPTSPHLLAALTQLRDHLPCNVSQFMRDLQDELLAL